MKEVSVSAAIVLDQDKFLCVQRGPGKYAYISYKYEFPGGKIEAGETGKEALRRELMEELRLELDLEVMEEFLETIHEYPDFRVVMKSYLCRVENPKFQLLEHVACQWLKGEEMLALDWAEADLPIVNALIKLK